MLTDQNKTVILQIEHLSMQIGNACPNEALYICIKRNHTHNGQCISTYHFIGRNRLAIS